MDWRKTKARIIIILLVLNVFLIYNLFRNTNSISLYHDSTLTMEELGKRLDAYGIKLSADVTKNKVAFSPLLVKYKEERPEIINQNYFDGNGTIEVNDQIRKISYKDEEINIINNRRFLYENLGKAKEKTEASKEAALDFLKDRGYEISDMVLVREEKRGKTSSYEFSKKYNGRILETSYTRVIFQDGLLVTLDRLWIEVISEDFVEIEIEPAYKALFSLIGQENLKGEEVVKVESCYYFNPEEQGLLEDNTRAEQGRAIPAWRIVFKSGKILTVDNY